MKVTVFTPVYNRANIIGKLKDSLVNQTVKDFEWLIIDDGSSDNICNVVKEFQTQQMGFDMVFISKENGGKHTCINLATDIAKGELFFIVDSDDYLSFDAIEKIINMYDSIEDKTRFCGVAGLRIHENGEVIGTTFNGEYIDATSLERKEYNITGDKSEVFITSILKKYKFPVFESERFITENVVWLKMAGDGYLIRWFNEPIYICEYLEGGLSDLVKKDLLKNFYGDIYTDSLYIRYYHYSLPMRIRIYGGAYERYLADRDKNKLQFILKNFGINKFVLSLSYHIYKVYKLVRRKS